MKKRILVYGDSNAWGFIPSVGKRFDEDRRWTKLMSSMLGNEYEVIEDCINGRTTIYEDPNDPLRNGLSGLGFALNSQAPLDLIVFHLGANDLKFTDARGAGDGIKELIRTVKNADRLFPMSRLHPHFPNGVKILVISPVCIHKAIGLLFPQSALAHANEESLKLKRYLKSAADEFGADFLDASECAEPSITDCVHMDEKSHKALACKAANKIIIMMGVEPK